MAYATIDDVVSRSRRELTESEQTLCETLLEDAAVIIDAYNASASEKAKQLASCNMIIRALGSDDASQLPIGATQGTLSALGYSQTFTMGNGSTGELYLTKLEKKLLGVGNKIAFASPWEESDD